MSYFLSGRRRVPHQYKADEWVSSNSLKWLWYRLSCCVLVSRRGMIDFYRYINNSLILSFLFVWTIILCLFWIFCWVCVG